MARIRTIKPGFWDKDECANVSTSALLLYIGMKNFADDQGVIVGNPKLIKSKVFPQRDDVRTDQVNKWIAELLANSFLVQLTYEDKLYYVLDFADEKIDKPQPSILPDEAFENIGTEFESNQDHSRTFENIRLGEERKGEERKRKGKECIARPEFPEFENYFLENGFSSELARKAYDHYGEEWADARGNPVKNWKQKARTVWFSEENKEKEKNVAPKKEKESRVQTLVTTAERVIDEFNQTFTGEF